MKVFEKISEIKNYLSEFRKEKTIGFVPTMGALHEGHLSLIRTSKYENDITVVSIYVNPTQFNDVDDFKNYPRMIDVDLEKLKSVDCDVVFCPDDREMYPEKDNRVFDLGGLDKVMEGKYREGHFNGVAQVVTKLFDIIQPHRAYFGQKDFQQLAIIKYLVQSLNIPVEIIGCPTVRESDGLAMSSRNLLLNAEERKVALELSKILFYVKENYKNFKSIEEIYNFVYNYLQKFPIIKLDYFEIVDNKTLQKINDINKIGDGVTACIAAKVGKIRLIDNVSF